jgi:tRNA pseudouridine55 synthase
MQGFLNLNKPSGLTSHDCVAKVRKLLKLKRVGHAGTLDPAATGVLPIALGTATRLLQFLPSGKAYQATIRFGQATTTDDLAGETLFQTPAPQLSLSQVKAALELFQGPIQQVPPIYSAIQVQGQRLYKHALKGEQVDVPSRQVEIFTLDVLAWRSGDYPELDLEIACGPGTYIRAIARDLGQVLGVGGTLAHLIRTASSGFQREQSLTFADLDYQLQSEVFQPILATQALQHLPRITLIESLATRWCQGQRIAWEGECASEQVCIYDEFQNILGISTCSVVEGQWILRPNVVLHPTSLRCKT